MENTENQPATVRLIGISFSNSLTRRLISVYFDFQANP